MDSKGGLKKSKVTYQVDSPYSGVKWPSISAKNENTILELLTSLLSPIGIYRSNHVTPSRGKRAKKRKRNEKSLDEQTGEAPTAPKAPAVPPPEALSHILVGLNTITRHLQTLSKTSRPETLSSAVENAEEKEAHDDAGTASSTTNVTPSLSHIGAILVSTSSHPSVLYSHLPVMVTTASAAHPHKQATRLVQLPSNAEIRLCESLGLPRAGIVAILDDNWPHSRALLDFTRDNVPSVQLDWLQEARDPQFRPTRINYYGATP